MSNNVSLFNNSLQNSMNQMNYDFNNNNDSGYSNNGELTRQLLNICNNQKLNLDQSNNFYSPLPGSPVSANLTGGSISNIISKFAPNKPKKEGEDPKDTQNLNKKRGREEDQLNLDNLLSANQANPVNPANQAPYIPNQQNQIFIINQYNKDALSSVIESALLNLLCGNNPQNITPSQIPMNNFMGNEAFDFNSGFNNNLLNIKNFIMNNNNQANLMNNLNNHPQNVKIEDLLGLFNNNKMGDMSKANYMNVNNQMSTAQNYSQNLLKLIKNSEVNRPVCSGKTIEKKVNLSRKKNVIFKIEKKSKN